MQRLTPYRACALLTLVTVWSTGNAFAAGYAVKETSASLQGMAYAGAAAGGEDISALFNNPAALGLYDGTNISAHGALIIPDVAVQADPFPNTRTTLGAPVDGSRSATTDDLAAIPATYGAFQINDTLSAGIGITAPYGLVTDYGRNWAGRYHATYSELLTLNVNPVVAYTPTPWFTFGAGIVGQYAKAQLENAVDFGTLARAGGGPTTGGQGATDGYARVEGDDIAFGGTVGVIIRPNARLRFGASYRSKIEHDLEGDVDFDVPAGFGGVAGALGLVDQDARAEAVTPASASFGIAYAVTDRLTLAAEADWTQWSDFEELRIRGDLVNPISVTSQEYDDSWFVSVGGSYQATPALKLRLGLAFDQGAANAEFVTPRVPGNDRYWFSAGASYDITDTATIDIGYTYVSVDDVDIALETGAPPNENFARGRLEADATGDVHVLMIGGTIRF